MYEADLRAMFDDADSAVDATLAGSPVRGSFNNPTQRASLGAVGINTTDPTFWLCTADVPADVDGVELVVPGAGTFRVRDVADDGMGLTILTLGKA